MTYLVSLSEGDLDLLDQALNLASAHASWLPGFSERFDRMRAELRDLSDRQDRETELQHLRKLAAIEAARGEHAPYPQIVQKQKPGDSHL